MREYWEEEEEGVNNEGVLGGKRELMMRELREEEEECRLNDEGVLGGGGRGS